jgi:hypothetical protein
MNRALKHELDIADNESKLSKALSNITVTNAQLINSVKAVTSGMTKLVNDEKTIFSQLDTIMNTEEDYLENLNDLIDSVDKTTTLIADYQMIQLQISLLIHLTDKTKSLVQSVLTHTLDTTLVPLAIIKPYLPDNLKTTLRLASYKLKYTAQGTTLSVEVPVLSNPYQRYNFHTVPFLMDNLWYEMQTPPDIAINAIDEFIDVQKVLPGCIHIHNDHICRSKDVTIFKVSGLMNVTKPTHPMMCAVRTVKTVKENMPMAKFPCSLEVLTSLEQQKYLIKDDWLMLSSPVIDSLTAECADNSQNDRRQIIRGLNAFSLKKDCHYETSQIVIHTVRDIKIQDPITDLDEIDTMNSISDLDVFLQQEFPIKGNMSRIKEQLRKYNSSLIQARHTVEDLSKSLANIDRIHQISDFDPTVIRLDEPLATSNWVTIMFWTLVFLLATIIAYGSYKTCPTKCTNCLAVPFIVLKNLCCVCAQVVRHSASAQYRAAPQLDVEMQNYATRRNNASAPQTEPGNQSGSGGLNVLQNCSYRETLFLQFNPTAIQWSVQLAAYEAYMIQAAINTSDTDIIRIRLNTVTNRVTDMDNNVLDYVPNPPPAVLDKYAAILNNAAPTPTFTDNEGTIRHKKYMFLTFNPVTRTWYNTQTGLTITGIPNPVEYMSAKCY